jgi:dienelactone hydrolase
MPIPSPFHPLIPSSLQSLLIRSCLLLTFALPALLAPTLHAAERHTGPWNMAELKLAPKAEFGEPDGLVREVYYENASYRGKPTRVFAYYAKPQGKGPFPAMLCVHGGGGKAFREWAELWAQRGYAALAMDTAGHGPGGEGKTPGPRLPDGGPDQDDNGKFGSFNLDTVSDMWTYHAVAAVVRGHSLLASLPEIDKDRIGITGISWGGYLTSIVTGIDDRLKVSIPVYGCGYLGEDSAWLSRFAAMSAAQRELWLDQFDPSRYLPGATCPMLWVNGTNDFAYPMGSYQKSYRLPKSSVTLCIRVRMPHGHPSGWSPVEIGLFADSVLRDGTPLPQIDDSKLGNGRPAASYRSATPITVGELHYTTDVGPWQKRNWQSVAATLRPASGSANSGIVEAPQLPAARPIVFFLSITDDRGAFVSSPHVQLD